MKNSVKKHWRIYGATLLIVTVLFTALYASYVIGEYFYAYSVTDTGSDTVKTYLPNIVFDIRNILQGKFNVYTLQRGLGEFYQNYTYKYLFVNLPLLLCGEANLHWGILLSVYLQYVLIGFFALLYFRRLFRSDKIAVLCAILWTFSGFNVLWGQHYQFLTGMLAFTIAMYGVQLFLENDRKRFLLVPALAVFAYTSYYFLYMSCYFFAVYSILYLGSRKAGAKDILKKAGIFACGLFIAACMAGENIIPRVAAFFQSTRMDNVAQAKTPGLVYTLEYLAAFLGRLFSSNMFGAGAAYEGPSNYYEVAILSVSVLFLFALVFLLQQRQWRRQTILATAIAFLAMCMPVVSRIIGFSVNNQRWTFVLCFAEVILIGAFLQCLFSQPESPDGKKKLLRTAAIADAIGIAALAALWVVQRYSTLDLKVRPAMLVALFFLIYSILFVIIPRMKKRGAYILLAILIPLELVAANYTTVNRQAGRMTRTEWYEAMYYDNTVGLADWLKEQDSGLYRVSKNYDSVGYNDSLIQGYNGVKVYSSTNAAELVNLYTSFGYQVLDRENGANWITFDVRDDVANALLGVKYLFLRPDTMRDGQVYKEVYHDGDGYSIYENRYYLGFGYLYREQISLKEFEALTPEEKQNARTQLYYFTNGEMGQTVGYAPQQGKSIYDNLTSLQENIMTDFSQDGNTFTGSITDPWEEDAMLCIPLIYSEHWRAQVDGEPVEAYNINGGLVGIYVDPGRHEISITYHDNTQQIGQIVGLGSSLIYLACVIVWWRRKGKHEAPADIYT